MSPISPLQTSPGRVGLPLDLAVAVGLARISLQCAYTLSLSFPKGHPQRHLMPSSYFVLKILLLRRMKYSQGLHSLLEMERFVLSVNRPFGKFAKEALAKQERRILVSNRSNNVFDSNPTDG